MCSVFGRRFVSNLSHHIAAGAILLAAKFVKVKLPSDGDKIWCRSNATRSNQMLELCEQSRMTQSSHPQASNGGGTNQNAKSTSTVSKSSDFVPQLKSNRSTNMEGEVKDSSDRECIAEALSSKSSLEQPIEDCEHLEKNRNTNSRYNDAIIKIDKDKVKAALEKQKRMQNDAEKMADITDEDDLIERELENGIEVALEDNNNKHKKQKFDVEENVQEEGELSFAQRT